MGHTRAHRPVLALTAAAALCAASLLAPAESASASTGHHKSHHHKHAKRKVASTAKTGKVATPAKGATAYAVSPAYLGFATNLLGGLGSLFGAKSTNAPAAAATTTGTGPTAQVWVTTADGSKQLASAPSATFGSSKLSDDLSIDTGTPLQEFSGAGASITESAASVIDTLGSSARTQLINQLFSTSGLHLSYLRQPLGGSDFVSHSPFYTYEDTKGTLDLSRDEADVLPLVKAAEQANPDLRVLGTPWTAPAWMKTNNSLTGGSLQSGAVQQYADYLVAVAKKYAADGVPLSDMTVQNEPGASTAYPSMTLSVSQEVAVVRAVSAGLKSAGLSTKLWVGDDNWNSASQVLSGLDQLTGVAGVEGAAFHCYNGSPSDIAQIISAGWRVYDTECSGTDSANTANTFGDTLIWQTQNLVVSALRSGAETVMLWNLALNASGGPQAGDCGTRCNGVVQIQNGTVTDDAQYDVLGQLSKFVDVGAHVVSSTTGGVGGVEDVAFVNPDGSRVALVLNDSTASQSFSITADGQSLDYTLPAASVATFVWN